MPKDADVKKANIELHDKTARIFEEKNVELFNLFEQRSLDKRLRNANNACKKHKVSCDLACGTGQLISRQTHMFENVIGLDMSRAMLKICKTKGLGNKAHFLLADAENLPFRDSIFDIVTIHAALHHLPSPSSCFKEMHRILVDEGIVYIDYEPNSKRISALRKTKGCLCLLGKLLVRKYNDQQSTEDLLFPPEYWMADIQDAEGFMPRRIRMQLESLGFCAVEIKYHNTFSDLFSRLPTPLNELSLVDNLFDNLPLVKHLSSHICVQAKK
jgi:ubiquinone/menaquinone biosynthesis C-methylase UbiE